MKKSTRLPLILSLCLIGTGLVICLITTLAIGGDFMSLDKNVYLTNEYKFTEQITSITIDSDTADIKILPSEDSVARVVCFETEKAKHAVTLENGTLNISKENTKWYTYILNINFRTPEITLYLPQKDYSNFSIDITTGDISLNNLTSADLDIKTITGDIALDKVNTNNATLNATTGDITLKNTEAQHHIEINVTTGDVIFKDSDAATLNCKTTTGDIKGNLLTPKTFQTKVTTGSVSVPNSTGGECKLKTTTGDIKINITS